MNQVKLVALGMIASKILLKTRYIGLFHLLKPRKRKRKRRKMERRLSMLRLTQRMNLLTYNWRDYLSLKLELLQLPAQRYQHSLETVEADAFYKSVRLKS